MENFMLKIETENAAFAAPDTLAAIAQILRQVAAKLDRGDPAGVIFDANGNNVGEFAPRFSD